MFQYSVVKAGVISAFFSLLFVIMMPISIFSEATEILTIVATGEHNTASKGSEIWIPKAEADRLLDNIVRLDASWEKRDGVLVSYQNQPSIIQSFLTLKSDKFLRFSTHEYSGIVDVRYGDASRRIDLYSPTQGLIKVDLSEIATMEVGLWSNIVAVIKPFIISFFAFFVLLLVLGRRSVSHAVKVEFPIAMLDIWIIFSSLIIYGLALAAYWPAQMSPDSISQWHQIVLGQYNDAHPIFSSLLYKLAYYIFPKPQSAVIFQIFIFTGATWLFLRECLAWGCGRAIVALSALLFPLFPANFLIVTTLWKDVPFAAGLIILSALVAREVRLGMKLRFNSLLLMGLAGIFVIAMRHNGILISVLFFSLLFFFANNGQARVRVSVILLMQITSFLLIKTFFLTALNVEPISPQYRAIVAIHVLGSMQAANVTWSDSDKRELEVFLDEQEWHESYRCETVVPLFWNSHLRKEWDLLGESTTKLNSIALKAIWRNPFVFLKHQACVTGLIWRVGGRDDEWLSISPAEITDIPERQLLGLQSHSVFPQLKAYIDTLNQTVIQRSTIYNRPALYSLIGLISMFAIAVRTRAAAWLIIAPLLANLLSLILIMGAQDYRYLWPSVSMSLLTFFMALGLAFGRDAIVNKSETLDGKT